MTERAGYHHADQPDALVEAGLRILDDRGLDAVSLRAVAREVGVSHAAPYHHFADKAALEAAMARAVSRGLGADLRSVAISSGADSPEIGIAYVCWAVRNPERFRLLSRSRRRGREGEERRRPQGHSKGFAFEALMESMRAGQEQGFFADGDPYDFATASWSMVHGLASLLLEGLLTDGPATEEQARELAEKATVILGLGVLRR